MAKKYKWVIILTIVVLVGLFIFFYSFYLKDMKALADFSASYEKYDQAISDFSAGETDDLEKKAGDTLTELNEKAAAFRLSSLIKNDAELMDIAQKIADFSGRELENLRAYKRSLQSQSADLDKLAKEYSDMTGKRKIAYSRFRELAEFKD